MVCVYHQVARDTAQQIVRHGLLQGSGGERRDKDIKKADSLLNELRPQHCAQRSLDRIKNVYGYLASGDKVIDIVTGRAKKPTEILEDPGQVLLQVEVDPRRCFVSDLDLYDTFLQLVKQGEAEQATKVGQAYWSTVRPLDSYDGSIHRPEVMVTYDVPASAILVKYEHAD